MKPQTQAVIDRLESMNKQGESYDSKGRHGWRNPIRADTGHLLRALVKAKNPTTVLEIGTAYGLSGCYIASAMHRFSVMMTIEWDVSVASEAADNFKEAGLANVHVKYGDALKVIKDIPISPVPGVGNWHFDMVFLDANKDGYLEQLNLLKELDLLNPNCLILADNVIDRASEMQDFLKEMAEKDAVILNTECGLLVATLK